MDLIAIAWRSLLAAIKHDLLARSIVLDVTVTVLSVQVFVERTFHALDALVLEIGESDDVTKHDAVRINSSRVSLEINAAQILRAQFLTERVGARFRNFTLQDDVASISVKFF